MTMNPRSANVGGDKDEGKGENKQKEGQSRAATNESYEE
jgi:hypothetical protein